MVPLRLRRSMVWRIGERAWAMVMQEHAEALEEGLADLSGWPQELTWAGDTSLGRALVAAVQRVYYCENLDPFTEIYYEPNWWNFYEDDGPWPEPAYTGVMRFCSSHTELGEALANMLVRYFDEACIRGVQSALPLQEEVFEALATLHDDQNLALGRITAAEVNRARREHPRPDPAQLRLPETCEPFIPNNTGDFRCFKV